MADAAGALDWNQLVTLLGLSAIISGGVSSSINYLIERRREKEKKAADVIKEQAELYSSFIYNLMILKGRWQSLYSYDKKEIQKAKEDIKKIKETIDPLLQSKIYLLTPGLLLTWSYMRQFLESPEFEVGTADLEEVLSHLFETLHGELDSNIIKNYEKVVGKFGHVEYLKDPKYHNFLLKRIKSVTDNIEVAREQLEQAHKHFEKETQEMAQRHAYIGSSNWKRDRLEKLLQQVREGLPTEGEEEEEDIGSKESRLAFGFIEALTILCCYCLSGCTLAYTWKP
jgi:F0F1-type ATP synthase membrane subunit b/b'